MREAREEGPYKPPAQEDCDCVEDVVELAADESRPVRYVLFHRIEVHRGKVVRFCLELLECSNDSGTKSQIMRIDSDDGTVHRHVFDQNGGHQRNTLVTIPPDGHDVVTQEYERAYDSIIDKWDEWVGRWQR